MPKQIEKRIFASEIIASELASLRSLYKAKNACNRHTMSLKTVLRFCISLRDAFSNSTGFTVINKYGKDGVFRFPQCLVSLTMLLVKGSSETTLFRHFFNHVFRVRKFGNNWTMRDILVLKMLEILSRFQKCRSKLRK